MNLKSISKLLSIASFSMIATLNISKAALVEGKDYVVLDTPPSITKEIREFFSFYCAHCYDFEINNHLSQVINDTIKAEGLEGKVIFIEQHTNFFHPKANLLSRGWIIAQKLNIKKKATELFYNAIQKEQKYPDTKEKVVSILVEAGADKAQVESNWDALATTLTLNKENKLTEDSKINSTPSFIVNGRYLIKADQIQAQTWEEYIKKIATISTELSKLP